MAVRHRSYATLARGGTPTQPSHLGVEARFVDKQEIPGVEYLLELLPGLTLEDDVRPILLGGAWSFFYRSDPDDPSGAKERYSRS